MRLLALADIHGDVERLRHVLASAGQVDLALVAGDFTEFGGAEELDAVLEAFGELRSKLVAVPGNCDRKAARERLAELGLSVDGLVLERGGVFTAGVGGGILRTGLTPYERRDEDLAAALQAAFAESGRMAAAGLAAPLVALSHQPPKDSGADDRRGTAVGSPALRAVLDAVAPLLWVCGHIHESPCARRLGPSLVLNPGPVNKGRYAIVDIEEAADGAFRAAAQLFP